MRTYFNSKKLATQCTNNLLNQRAPSLFMSLSRRSCCKHANQQWRQRKSKSMIKPKNSEETAICLPGVPWFKERETSTWYIFFRWLSTWWKQIKVWRCHRNSKSHRGWANRSNCKQARLCLMLWECRMKWIQIFSRLVKICQTNFFTVLTLFPQVLGFK